MCVLSWNMQLIKDEFKVVLDKGKMLEAYTRKEIAQ